MCTAWDVKMCEMLRFCAVGPNAGHRDSLWQDPARSRVLLPDGYLEQDCSSHL